MRIFAHDEWRITSKWLLNAGGMFERDGMGHQNLSPRVTLNFHVSPLHTLRVGTSTAYRTPSLVEERYPIDRFISMPAADRFFYLPGALFVASNNVTSPGLVPEKLVSHEIGYLGEFPDLSASLDLRLFSDELDDGTYIASTNKFKNGVSSLYQGFEATFKHTFNWNGELTANFAHELASSNGPALVAAGQTSLRSNSQWDNDILSASTPRNNLSLLYSQRLPEQLSLSVAYYRQDALQPFDRGAVDYQPIQNRVDVRIAKGFKQAGGISGDLALVVQNLFKTDYTEYISSNLFNQRNYVTLTVNW
jgi:iron complex outermembrane receptor protein